MIENSGKNFALKNDLPLALSQKDLHMWLTIYELTLQKSTLAPDLHDGIAFTTREVANACDVDIYSARYSLLKLSRHGYVVSFIVEGKKRNSWMLKESPDKTKCIMPDEYSIFIANGFQIRPSINDTADNFHA